MSTQTGEDQGEIDGLIMPYCGSLLVSALISSLSSYGLQYDLALLALNKCLISFLKVRELHVSRESKAIRKMIFSHRRELITLSLIQNPSVESQKAICKRNFDDGNRIN